MNIGLNTMHRCSLTLYHYSRIVAKVKARVITGTLCSTLIATLSKTLRFRWAVLIRALSNPAEFLIKASLPTQCDSNSFSNFRFPKKIGTGSRSNFSETFFHFFDKKNCSWWPTCFSSNVLLSGSSLLWKNHKLVFSLCILYIVA